MIKKIISGGQTGADRAALDAAIEVGIPHGGWVPKGRIAEDGSISEKYQLKEMPTDSYLARTEQNVIDSNGTVIIAHRPLTGGSDYTREMTLKHKKQLLFVDLNNYEPYDAATLVASWIKLQRIEILNVAGPRASEDPEIYHDVLKIMEETFQILRDEERKSYSKPQRPEKKKSSNLPKTVDEAVGRLISEMSLKDRIFITNMAEADLIGLHFSLGLYIISVRLTFE
jgi:hypothetical protein